MPSLLPVQPKTFISVFHTRKVDFFMDRFSFLPWAWGCQEPWGCFGERSAGRLMRRLQGLGRSPQHSGAQGALSKGNGVWGPRYIVCQLLTVLWMLMACFTWTGAHTRGSRPLSWHSGVSCEILSEPCRGAPSVALTAGMRLWVHPKLHYSGMVMLGYLVLTRA